MTFTVCTDMNKLFITLVSDHGHCHDSYRLRTELDLFADRPSTDMDSTDKKISSDGGSIGKIIAVGIGISTLLSCGIGTSSVILICGLVTPATK